MSSIKIGSRGDNVAKIQYQLKAIGYYLEVVDGIFGPRTDEVVREFQKDFGLEIDGIVDLDVAGRLDQASSDVSGYLSTSSAFENSNKIAPSETIKSWLKLVETVISHPCVYVKGRGDFKNDNWIIKRKSGVGSDLGAHGFVCSTWTNFSLGFLTRRNELFTHQGGMPSLFRLCTVDNSLHEHKLENGSAKFRGYGDWCKRIKPKSAYMTPRELYEMREELPTFLVAASSSVRNGKVTKWWHHTMMWWIDHETSGNPMFRIAADGSSGNREKMNVEEVSSSWISDYGKRNYLRCYSVVGLDSESVTSRPIRPVVFE